MTKKIVYLESRLSSLRTGDRCWFWFTPDAAELPLLLEHFSNPRGMAKLMQRARSLDLPPGAEVCTGITAVSDSGEMQFASPLFEDWMLERLAAWVSTHHQEHPSLSLLSGAKLIKINANGSVQARFENKDLWTDIPRPPRAGTLQAAALALDALKSGEEAWFWAAPSQAGPIVIALPIEPDPKAEQFGALVLAGRQRAGGAAGVRGVARRLGSGGLLVTTADDLGGVGPQVSSWLAERGEVRLAQSRDGEIVAGRLIGGVAAGGDLSAQCRALEAILAGETYAFWFTRESKGGGPVLLLEESPAALKGLAMAANSGAPSVRGQIRAASWGLEFRARSVYKGFLEQVSGWAAQHHAQWPALRALAGARMSVRDRDGKVVYREKNDQLWAELRPHRS